MGVGFRGKRKRGTTLGAKRKGTDHNTRASHRKVQPNEARVLARTPGPENYDKGTSSSDPAPLVRAKKSPEGAPVNGQSRRIAVCPEEYKTNPIT